MNLTQTVSSLRAIYPKKLKFHIKRKNQDTIIELEFGHNILMKELSDGLSSRSTKEKYSPSYKDLISNDWLVYDRNKRGFFPLEVGGNS